MELEGLEVEWRDFLKTGPAKIKDMSYSRSYSPISTSNRSSRVFSN